VGVTRDEVRTRSEGALDGAELALRHVENGLNTTSWFAYARAQTRMPERLDDAIEQVARLDARAGAELRRRYARCLRLARKRLTRLGAEPTATRLEDTLAQLVARARQLDAPPRQAPSRGLLLGGAAASALTGALVSTYSPWHLEAGVVAIVFAVLGVLLIIGNRDPAQPSE
jgi:CRP-like cAMP-binding protein